MISSAISTSANLGPPTLRHCESPERAELESQGIMDAHHRGGGRAALLLSAFAVVACAPDPPTSSIAAKNYERKCASVADCVPVYEGHIGCCGGGECPNTVIAQVA